MLQWLLDTQREKFRLEVKKNFFSERMVSHGNKLLRAVVESPWLRAFKNRMDVALGDMV